jgi:hypothetical protein
MSSNTQVQSHHQTPVQLGVGQAYMYQGTGGERYNCQIPFNLHYDDPVNDMTIYPRPSGGLYLFPPGHRVS